MQFPDSYFESEVREGFYVPSMMKRVWASQLEILEDIDKVCKKYNIPYYADWGTMLGAVRHGGYIPWDDDMDISMKREDYRRFIAIAQQELPKGYQVLNAYTQAEYGEMFTRVVNGTHIDLGKEFLDKFHGCPYVMGVDVFPLDYLAPNPEEEKYRCELIRMVNQVRDALSSESLDEATRERYLLRIEEMCNTEIDRASSLKGQLYQLIDRLCGLYSEKESEELTLMPLWLQNGKYKVPKSYYQSVVEVSFENTTIPVPALYDMVMEKKYGDYMRLVKDGGAHDYPYYREQEMALEKRLGRNPYRYIFSSQDLEATGGARRKSHRSMLREQLRLFHETGNVVSTLLMRLAQPSHLLSLLSEKDVFVQTDKGGQEGIAVAECILAKLTECQNAAIGLGTLIEELYGEGRQSVVLLERYCELIYQIYEAVTQSGTMDETWWKTQSLRVDNFLTEIKDCVKTETDMRYRAIFMPYKASSWGAMESVWRAACEDPACEVYVMPLPFFYKNADGSAGEVRYEAKLYPDDVPITGYDTFDFAGNIPEMIFIQVPYDEYDSCVSVHPFFYAKNLRQYTEQLIYIPEFVVGEDATGDERAKVNMRHCCVSPGVVYADKVIVQSEDVCRMYVEILTEAAGEDTRVLWEKKIVGIGAPIWDADVRVRKEAVLPQEWRKYVVKLNGEWKKVVLYRMNIGTLWEYGDKALNKLKQVFAEFKARQAEMTLLWLPEALAETTLTAEQQELWAKYCDLMVRFAEEGVGICDTTGDARRAIQLCDAYYGDRNYVMHLCREAGVPVMAQKV